MDDHKAPSIEDMMMSDLLLDEDVLLTPADFEQALAEEQTRNQNPVPPSTANPLLMPPRSGSDLFSFSTSGDPFAASPLTNDAVSLPAPANVDAQSKSNTKSNAVGAWSIFI